MSNWTPELSCCDWYSDWRGCIGVTAACDGGRRSSAERSRRTDQCRPTWATGNARSAASPSRSPCCCGAWRSSRWRRSTPPRPTWTTSSETTGASGASTTTGLFTPSERFITRAPRRVRARAPWTVPCASDPGVPASTPDARESDIRHAVRCARLWPGSVSTGAERTGSWRSSGWENFNPPSPVLFTSSHSWSGLIALIYPKIKTLTRSQVWCRQWDPLLCRFVVYCLHDVIFLTGGKPKREQCPRPITHGAFSRLHSSRSVIIFGL